MTRHLCASEFNNGAYVERRTVRRDGGLAGHTVGIKGLSATSTDVLVRIETLDGTVQTERLTPTRTTFIVRATPNASDVAFNLSALGCRAHPVRLRSSAIRSWR